MVCGLPQIQPCNAGADESGSVAAEKIATVQLSVSNGTLLVTLSPGTTVSAGSNGSNTLTLSGSQAAINATLATLGYQGNANYVGGDTLVVITRDGLGLTDSDSIAITVNPVNDAPSGADRTITMNEDSAYALSRNDFGFVDVEVHAAQRVDLAVRLLDVFEFDDALAHGPSPRVEERPGANAGPSMPERTVP